MDRCPNCTWKELSNNANKSTVKAYAKVEECDKCRIQREIDALKAEEDNKKSQAEQLISERMRQIAKQQLIDEGILDSEGNLKE